MKNLCFVLFLFVSVSALAQDAGLFRGKKSSFSGTIKGKILDSISNENVEFATIAVKKSGTEEVVNGTVTDEKGQFKIVDIPVGKYDVVVSFLGYTEKTFLGIELTLKDPDYNLMEVKLTPNNLILDEVEVTAKRASVENKIDRVVFNTNDDPTLRGGDASDVLSKVPMLSVDLDGNVSLRGSQNLKILVNGKPSGLFSSSIADALKMLPADQIASVEVITSPGAKYDAEGTGGIINIVTKKKRIDGIAGNIGTTVGTRSNRLNFSLNYARGRFGLNGNTGIHFSPPRGGNYESTNIRYLEGEVINNTLLSGKNESTFFGGRGQFGAFYDFNAFNSINSNISFRGFSRSGISTNESIRVTDITQQYITNNNGGGANTGFDWTTDYTKKFDTEGHELTIAAQLNKDISLNETNIDWIGDINNATRADNQGVSDEWTFLVDYTKPINDQLKIEVGAKSILRDIKSDYDFREREVNGEFVIVPGRTNLFEYNQDVTAGYVSANWNFAENWGLQAGGRYELTKINFENPEEGSSDNFKNSYDNFVPSIIVSRKFGFTTIKASYAKRLQRPRLRNINPYEEEDDDRNVTRGNPYLRPELSDQFEIGISSFIKGVVVNFSTYYRKTNDLISQLYFIEANKSIETYENLGESENIGFNIFGSGTIKEKLTLRTNIDVNNTEIVGSSELFGKELKNRFWNYRIFANGTLSLNKGWKVEVFGFYNSPRRTLQGERTSFSMMSLGFNKDIFNDRGSIGINVTRPFRKYITFENVRETENISLNTKTNILMRSFGINFNYRFGKLDFNPRKSKRGSKIKNNDQGGGDDSQQEY